MGKFYNTFRSNFILLILLLLVFNSSFAQRIDLNENAVENYRELDLSTKGNDNFFSESKRARTFNLNRTLQNASDLARGRKVLLGLFSDKKFDATVIGDITDINGIRVITLKIDKFEYGYAYLTLSKTSSLLSVQIPELNEKYLTRYHPETKNAYLLSIDPKKQKRLDSCGSSSKRSVNQKDPIRSIPKEKDSYNSESEIKITEGGPVPVNYCRTPDGLDQVVIDIMVVYSDEAKVFADENEGGIDNTIALAIANANNISSNSELGITYNLVYSGPAYYSDSNRDSGEHLNALRVNGDGYMDHVHSIREEVGADMVAIFTYRSNVGGRAYLLSDKYGNGETAYSLTDIVYASNSNVFAHELGHNLGAMHNKYQNVQAGPTNWENWNENTWSAGWRWTGDDGNVYTSVMSYPQGDYYEDNINSVQVPYFSDSKSFYLGGRMGDEFEGDNTRTLRETKYVVSEYSNSFSYCTAGSSNYEAAGIDQVILGDIDNYSGNVGYTDFSTITTCVYPQEVIDAQVQVSGVSESKELLIWVDWNDDKTFDNPELVYQSTESLSDYSVPIQVPLNTTPGIKRLRIRLHDTEFGGNSTACGESEIGEVEDYALNVLEPSACTTSSIPQNILISGIQHDGFKISWSPIEGISNYELRYKKFEETSWTTISNIYYTNFEFTNLQSETQYEIQLRSNCSATQYSEYSGALIATTNPGLNELVFSETIQDGQEGVILPAISVKIKDVYGNLSNSNARVELRLIDNYSTGARLSGYLPKRAENGVAVFDELRIDKLGPYAIEAFIEGLPAIRSNEFNILAYTTRTFIVNTVDDTKDTNLKDALCADINGNCSLRAALQNANSTSGKDIINFNIPGEGVHRILPNILLPKIKYPVDLDATTQPGYAVGSPKIVISGENIPVIDHDENLPVIPRNEQATCFDLVYKSSGSSIKGFVLGGFGRMYDEVYHSGSGIVFSSTTDHIIQANFIGVDADGETAFPNIWGIIVGEPENMTGNNLIGGPNPEDRNIISGNIRDGIHIGYYGSQTLVQGNYIGTNKAGTAKLGNDKGVSIGVWAHHNVLDGNLISGNWDGVEIRTDYNTLINNYIGTNAVGNDTIPNYRGIYLYGKNNFIGIPGEGNLISGNRYDGVALYGERNVLKANLVGSNSTMNSAIPNSTGINVGGTSNEIGGTAVGSGNTILGNTDAGLKIYGSVNTVFGNQIGKKSDDASFSNDQIGIVVSGSNNLIGGANTGEANIISNNTEAGVVLRYGTVLNNKISANSIYGNPIGIDLNFNGKTRNDRGDSDQGANKLQNYPDLSKASSNGSLLEISYILDSEPEYSVYPIRVEVFKSDGNEQGIDYLGAFFIDEYKQSKGNSSQSAQLQLISGSDLKDGDLIIATATDAEGNTSEFSDEVSVTITGTCTSQTWYADADGDGLGNFEISVDQCSVPQGYVTNPDDCDDSDSEIGALQTWYLDNDGDGFGDANISTEKCTQPFGYVLDNTDCYDTDNRIFPGAVDDTTDGIDQDCDGIDGPVSTCQGTDLLQVSETCSTSTNVYWQITNPSNCNVPGRWELRKSSSSGASSGDITLSAGVSIEVISGSVSKGKTQIVVYWNDSNGLELNTSLNAAGIECTSGMAMLSQQDNLLVAPNPVEEGIGMYFTAPGADSSLSARVYNSSGRMMASDSFSIKSETDYLLWDLDHSSWIDGVYILNVSIGKETYQTQFIK